MMGMIYLKSMSSSEAIIKDITFTSIETAFGNGTVNGELWTTADSTSHKAILAKVSTLRTFLALAEWLILSPLSDPSLPLYFTLPEHAVSVRTYIAGQSNIAYPPNTDNLKGVLLSSRHVGFKFAQGETVTDTLYTGAHIPILTPQELAVIIIYTTSQ